MDKRLVGTEVRAESTSLAREHLEVMVEKLKASTQQRARGVKEAKVSLRLVERAQ